MKLHAWILPVVTGAMLSGIYLLPKSKEMAPSAISMDLPDRLGVWEFKEKPPSKEEIKLLAEDTQFSKATCWRPRLDEVNLTTGVTVPDRIDLSVVLSGHDLNNSIHRPERCMPSQGHVIGSASSLEIELSNGHTVPVRRLLSVQSVPRDDDKGEYTNHQCVTYYFFVGHKTLTEDHIHRTLIDMKDRLLFGMDQRWAYVSVSMWYGKVPWIKNEISVEEADHKLQKFIEHFSKDQINWERIK